MRIFIAIDITNEDVKNYILRYQERLLSLGIKAKPIPLNQLHFTLLFIGEVSERVVESIKEGLKDLKFKSINVRYKGLGAFPNPKSARIVWIGVDEESRRELIQLVSKIEEKLLPLGLKNNEEFFPHVTILRVKDRADVSKFINQEELGNETFKNIKIKKSDLTQSGPIYTDLLTIDLI